MLPMGCSWETTYNFLIEGWKRGVKSLAAYPDKKMYGIVSSTPFKELALQLKEEEIFMHHSNFSYDELKELHLSAQENGGITLTKAPKRPEILPCEIHQVSVQGNKWTVLVGLMDDKPYEVFGGESATISIPKKVTEGFIKKRKCSTPNAKGRNTCYDLYYGDPDDPTIVKDIVVTFDNADYAIHTRLMSLSLRHGSPVDFLVEQLGRDSSSTIVDFTKVMARVLRKYVRTLDDNGNVLKSEDSACRSGKCD